jgi:hypothetical protein
VKGEDTDTLDPGGGSQEVELAAARDGIERAFQAMHYVVGPGDSDLVDEWARFEVTRHEVDVRYRGQWYCVTFCEYPDGDYGDYGDGWIWRVGADGAKQGTPLKLSQEAIGSIVDGAGSRYGSPDSEME